jgi:ribose-phosphate pyrophosphokinase
MKIIKYTQDKEVLELPFTTFTFPGGEVGLKLKTSFYKFFDEKGQVAIEASIKNSEDFMRVAMAKNALENLGVRNITLYIPYLPYARQDRVCDAGEAFSLKVFTNLVNSLNFFVVMIVDPHSDVANALINNLIVTEQHQVIEQWDVFATRVGKATFISPDAGANKKTAKLAKYFNHVEFIRADKLRDLSTGEIKETIVYADDLTGREIVIADDICDGGRTFIELAKVLKSKNASKVILYVTHGIFSKGVDVIFDGGIDEIWTTNSFHDSYDPRVNVFNVKTL